MADLKNWCQDQLSKMRDDVDRSFEAFCTDFGVLVSSSGTPGRMSAQEDDQGVTVALDLPDWSIEDIAITAGDFSLAVAGRKGAPNQAGGERVFRKDLRLPFCVVPEETTATFRGATLIIRLPKRSARPGRNIAITSE
jgi:HSP20 family protein